MMTGAMMASGNADEAAQILTRIFEAICRLNHKTLSAGTKADIGRACALLANAGAELDDLFEDLPPLAPRRSPGEAAVDPGWDDFERWRNRNAS